MSLRGEISILVPAVFSEIVAILTAPAVKNLTIFYYVMACFVKHDLMISLF
jgi:hypothetical protein